MTKSVEISVDEYLSKRGLTSSDGMVYRAMKPMKTFDAEKRSARFVMTDESVDSYGDIVKAGGARLERFLGNPICLLNHRSDKILGTWDDIATAKKAMQGTVTLARAGTSEHVDEAYALMEQSILKAASIGFMPLKVERRLDDDGEPMWSYIIHEYELYECSVVSIPANPAALAKSIKSGNHMAKDLLEQVLDEYVKTPAGLIVPRAEYEAAHKDASGDRYSVLSARLDEISAKIDLITPADPVVEDAFDVEEFQKSFETSIEQSIAEFEPKIAEIKAEEHKSAFRALVDGIKSIFKAPENTETGKVEEEIPAVVQMTAEERSAILERAKAFAPAN